MEHINKLIITTKVSVESFLRNDGEILVIKKDGSVLNYIGRVDEFVWKFPSIKDYCTDSGITEAEISKYFVTNEILIEAFKKIMSDIENVYIGKILLY